MNTYIIEGGIGKQVAFTAIIDALVKKDKEKIQIHSPYVDIFGGNFNAYTDKHYTAYHIKIPYSKKAVETVLDVISDMLFIEGFAIGFLKSFLLIVFVFLLFSLTSIISNCPSLRLSNSENFFSLNSSSL